jgi:hypothetical protein
MANTATTKTKLDSAGTDRPKSAERTTRTAGQGAEGWGDSARRFVRRNPAAVLIGAFIIGVALAKVARHA